MESTSRSRATVSQHEQWMVQNQVFQIYDIFANIPPKAQTLMLELQRDTHIEYLTRALLQLGPSFVVLDANRPWLCYWILHSIALLGECLDFELENSSIDFLNRCQDPDGGYGGGPGQESI
ncbi:Protein farnesyltransferase subunit beta [Euphorbia peplus]|nr:Protein farnesyltransferase subunit beta [Euphorbia peplus]